MDLATNLHHPNLRCFFFTPLRPFSSPKPFSVVSARKHRCKITSQLSTTTNTTTVEKIPLSETENDIESLFSSDSSAGFERERRGKGSNTGGGASSVSSGVKLENISRSYKGVTLLKNVSWEVKKGEKVGLVGVNGAGKTTQLRIITGQEQPDSGNVVKAKTNMKIALKFFHPC